MTHAKTRNPFRQFYNPFIRVFVLGEGKSTRQDTSSRAEEFDKAYDVVNASKCNPDNRLFSLGIVQLDRETNFERDFSTRQPFVKFSSKKKEA